MNGKINLIFHREERAVVCGWSDSDFFSGMELRILEFLHPPPTLYLSTYFSTDLYEFHLSEICTARGKVSLVFCFCLLAD